MKTPLELAQTRYATKMYDPNKKIPEDKIQELKNVLRLCPSSIDIQPWKFTFVKDPIVKSKLASASLYNEDKINQADLLVVFSYPNNLKNFQKIVDEKLPQTTRDMYNSSSPNMTEDQLKNWFIRQVYIALGFGLTTAIALGLDSTPMEGLEPDKYMAILGMQDYTPILGMAVGYRDPNDYNRPEVKPKSRLDFDDVIISI